MSAKISLVIFFVVLFSGGIFAQFNQDSIFNIAVTQAHDGDYSSSIKNLEIVLDKHPLRNDVALFTARVLGWNGDYEQAEIYLQDIYKRAPQLPELYDVWLNILLWAGDDEDILHVIEKAEQNGYTNNGNVLIKKVIALKRLGHYNKALNVLTAPKNRNWLDSSHVRSLYYEIQQIAHQNILTAFYSVNVFEKNSPSPWHWGFIDYAFKLKRHTLVARVNYASRFNLGGFQMELDYYHIFKNGHYIYSNYGYSNNHEVFPNHRAGLEYYFSPLKSLEVSLGGRFMRFSGASVWIATGHLGKYFKNYWLAVRPFYSFLEEDNAFSLLVNCRKYGKIPINYWGVELGYGNDPDERNVFNLSGEAYRLESYRVKLERNRRLGLKSELKFTAGYAYDEYIEAKFRNRFLVELTFKYRL